MIEAILNTLYAIFSAIPVIANLFKPKPNKEAQKARDSSRSEMDEFKKTGRPPDDGR